MMKKFKVLYAEDDKTPILLLLRLRIPPLVIGLFIGITLSFLTSQFEEVLSKNISIAFFIPFIVYMADAVGTQTQSIYARDLKTGRANFKIYLIKETFLGLILGLIFSIVAALIVLFWFKSLELVLAVSLATFGAVATAPIIALLVTEFLELDQTDPAVGAGPIATVIQDTVSVLLYGLIATAVFL
jgi:magnesium transporter